MDEKTKNSIISNALERGEVRLSLELWQHLPVIDGLCDLLKDNDMKRHTMLMSLLEDIAVEAWRNGRRRGIEETYAEAENPAST